MWTIIFCYFYWLFDLWLITIIFVQTRSSLKYCFLRVYKNIYWPEAFLIIFVSTNIIEKFISISGIFDKKLFLFPPVLEIMGSDFHNKSNFYQFQNLQNGWDWLSNRQPSMIIFCAYYLFSFNFFQFLLIFLCYCLSCYIIECFFLHICC